MLAVGRWTLYHSAVCCYQGSRHRRAQRGHVSHPDLRRPHHRHALAIAKSRRPARPPLLRDRHAHARQHFHRRRPRVRFRRHRAVAGWPRRIPAGRLSPQKIRRTRQMRDQRPRSPRQCRLCHRRLRGPEGTVARGRPVRRSHRLLHLARAISGVPHHGHHASQ